MLDMNEPERETVRMPLPPKLQPTSSAGMESRGPQPVVSSRPSPVPPRRGPGSFVAQATPRPAAHATAQISVLPDLPKPKPAVQMKKTQPLSRMPDAVVPAAPLRVAPPADLEPQPEEFLNPIPIALCWLLFVVSAGILIIEIWTYLF